MLENNLIDENVHRKGAMWEGGGLVPLTFFCKITKLIESFFFIKKNRKLAINLLHHHILFLLLGFVKLPMGLSND